MLKRILLSLLLLVAVASQAMADARPMNAPVVIFISFSMPDASIQNILQDAAKINAPVVLRGLINHSIEQTMSKLNQFSQNGQGVQIDPDLFTRFNITQVPAVLIQNKDAHKVIYGDLVLADILAYAARDQDLLDVVEPLAEKLKDKL